MSQDGIKAGFTVKQPAEKIYAAINDVRGWWTGDIEGESDAVGAEFTYRHKDMHRSQQRVATLEPNRRVVWRVIDANLSFAAHPEEWTGTDIVFDIVPHGEETELRFTHVGITPACDCYRACSGGWDFFVNKSLRDLIETGRGRHDFGA